MDVTLDSLDAKTASDGAFEFEFINSSGVATGLWFKVLGGQSKIVTDAFAQRVNDLRRKAAASQARVKIGGGPKPAEFETYESDSDYNARSTALRLVGWRGPGETAGLTPEQVERFKGISPAWSPENALKLCRTNDAIAAQLREQSDEVGNFIQI